MVVCVHIVKGVRIAAVNIEQLKLSDNHYPSPKVRAHLHIKEDGITKTESHWNCVACGTTESPLLCLCCGLIHCGRYVNGDGLTHFSHYADHSLTMDCINYDVYCYKCDDYVNSDTIDQKILSIKNSLEYHNTSRSSDHCYSSEIPRIRDANGESQCDEGTEDEDADQNDQLRPKKRSADRDEEAGSVLEDSPSLSTLLLGGRALRPRKRKISPEVDIKFNDKDDGQWKGLRNLGNSCFMNAVLQALNSIAVFREFVVSLPVLEYEQSMSGHDLNLLASPRYKTRRYTQTVCNGDAPTEASSSILAEELRKTLILLSSNGAPSVISPDALFHAVWGISNRFAGYSQQDCHEFLRYTLDRLHSDLRRCRIPDGCAFKVANCCGMDYSSTSSAVSLIFEGALQSQVTCVTCHMTSNKQDPFLDLSLDINLPLSPNARSTTISLVDCIHRFFAMEELEQCEQYMCGGCQAKRPSTKQLFLRTFPKVLCLHLKRFRWSHASRGKVDNMVDFPLRGLDLNQFVAPNVNLARGKSCVYDLSSVVVHHGSGMGGGHYTCYGRRNDVWAHYNDSSVKLTDSETVLKQKAYLLFYTRVN